MSSSAPASSGTTVSATTGRPMRADARRNYELLVEAAKAVLVENDGDAPLEDIARRAGVGIGTLYRHFPKRLDLLEAVYREEVDALAHSKDRLVAEVPPWEGLERWLHLLVGYVATKRVLFQELVDAIGKESELLTHSRAVMMDSTSAMLKAAQDAGVARADVRPDDLVRIVGGCTMMPHVEPDQQERMVQIVLDGVRI